MKIVLWLWCYVFWWYQVLAPKLEHVSGHMESMCERWRMANTARVCHSQPFTHVCHVQYTLSWCQMNQPLNCLPQNLFRLESIEPLKVHITSLYEDNPLVITSDSSKKGPVMWEVFPCDDIICWHCQHFVVTERAYQCTNINGVMQKQCNSIANTLELRLCCIKSSYILSFSLISMQ